MCCQPGLPFVSTAVAILALTLAGEFHAINLDTVYICPICEAEHDSMKVAEQRVLGHADLEGADYEPCPNCLRPAETAQLMVELAVAGHCSTCNPIYSPDQNLKIKYSLEPKGI